MNKKILIADDHYVVRLGTSMALENNFTNLFIDYAENYSEVLAKLNASKFDLLILDINMPGSIYKNMIKDLKNIQEDLLIMIFSSFEETVALEYIQEGADGYLNKLCNERILIKAVKAIFEEGYYYPLNLVKLLTDPPQKIDIQKLLSEREVQVFTLLAEGNGNIEIANILDIQVTTVSTYKRRIYAKLGISNLVDLLKIYNTQT